MTTYEIKDITNLMHQILEMKGIDRQYHDIIIEDYLGAQLQETFTHGISKFLMFDRKISEDSNTPEFIVEGPNYALLDGHNEIGQICAQICTEKLFELLESNGIAFVAMRNAGRYARAGTFAKLIASQNYVGIISNNGGPSAVLPHGSIDPIYGVNPIAFGFPNDPESLVIDFAAAQDVWGKVTQAAAEKSKISSDSFVDEKGIVTHDPYEAEAVYAMGGAKGAALSLALEILTGALIGAKMGLDIEDVTDVGTIFIGIDPQHFTQIETFKNTLDKLLSDIRATRPDKEYEAVRAPGDRATQKRKYWKDRGEVPINDETYQSLCDMLAGKKADLPV